MLQSLQAIRGYSLKAEDREFGRITDFLFNSLDWAIWYVVATTRSILPSRKVAIPAAHFAAPNWERLLAPVSLTYKQIRKSFSLQAVKRGAWFRQSEPHLNYRRVAHRSGFGATDKRAAGPSMFAASDRNLGSRLCTVSELYRGYVVAGIDGLAGQVVDLILDDQTWAIRYLAVAPHAHPDNPVVIETSEIAGIRPDDHTILTSLPCARYLSQPEYTPANTTGTQDSSLGRFIETYYDCLYDRNGRSRYGIR